MQSLVCATGNAARARLVATPGVVPSSAMSLAMVKGSSRVCDSPRFLRSRYLRTSCRAAAPDGRDANVRNPSSNTAFQNILSSPEDPPRLHVVSVSEHAITLSDGLVIESPCILMDGGVALLWRAPPLDAARITTAASLTEVWRAWEDVTCWSCFEVASPKPDLLVIGTGNTVLPLPPHIKRYLNSLGMQVDVQATHNAAATYNLLSEEGRRVAAALLPAVSTAKHE